MDCKLYYTGEEEKRNGVGIVLRGDIKKTVVEVIRVNRDRLMAVRAQLKNVMVFVVAAYAPQSGLEEEVKQQFRDELQALTDRASDGEFMMVLDDMRIQDRIDKTLKNASVAETTAMQKGNLLEMCSFNGSMIENTWFEKRDSQLYTYYSGRSKTQIDMIIVRKAQWKYVMDAKVIPSETVHGTAAQTSGGNTESR